jgi:hypothetical protein
LCGLVVMLLELLLFALPVSIVAFVPKLFFGAVLTFISLDLLLDWLWAARSKVCCPRPLNTTLLPKHPPSAIPRHPLLR